MSDVMYKMPLDMLTRRYYTVTSDCTKIGDPIQVNKVFQTMLHTDNQLPLPTCGNSFGVLPIGFLRKVGPFTHVPRYSIDEDTIRRKWSKIKSVHGRCRTTFTAYSRPRTMAETTVRWYTKRP